MSSLAACTALACIGADVEAGEEAERDREAEAEAGLTSNQDSAMLQRMSGSRSKSSWRLSSKVMRQVQRLKGASDSFSALVMDVVGHQGLWLLSAS